MTRYFLLLFLLNAPRAFSQSYEISVFGIKVTDPVQLLTLYSQSVNQGNISVQDKRKNKEVRNIRVKSDQGKIKKQDGFYQIEPNDTSILQLNIYKGRKLIGRQPFRIKDPPEPKIDFLYSGDEILRNGFIIKVNNPISFVFRPDTAFAALCPADTNYIATAITVVRNGNVRNPEKINGSFNLENFDLKPGETIKLELNRYKRINYKGEALVEEASPDNFLILKIQ